MFPSFRDMNLLYAEAGDRCRKVVLVLALLVPCAASPALLAAECRVTGEAPAADLALARAACDRATERFSQLYGISARAGTIEVSDTLGFFAIEAYAPEWKLIWPNSERMREHFARQGEAGRRLDESLEMHWTAVLPHELGHLLLVAEEDARRPLDRAPRRLPDWLHEGTAVWMEPPATRQDDFAILPMLRPYIPQLDSLLAFTISDLGDRDEGGSTVIQTFYPCASDEACGGRPHWSRIFSVRTRYFPDGRIQVDTTFHTEPPPPPSPTGSYFYPYSATLVRYLFERGGAVGMSTLLDRYVHSVDGTAPLTGLAGLPDDRARLEEDWQAWFRSTVFAE